jgi:hypothetical protein
VDERIVVESHIKTIRYPTSRTMMAKIMGTAHTFSVPSALFS